MSSGRQIRTAAALLSATGAASASMIAARMPAFSSPTDVLSTWHLSEARRMTSEKINAASECMRSASAELALLPSRMLMISVRPSSRTAAGWMNAWQQAAVCRGFEEPSVAVVDDHRADAIAIKQVRFLSRHASGRAAQRRLAATATSR